MSACYLCGSDRSLPVLEKAGVEIWMDAGDDGGVPDTYPCVLRQCDACGHVYQPVTDELRALMTRHYQGRHVQGPSPMGVGRWGTERANALFLDEMDLTRHRSAVEIGCGEGYLLRQLKARGFDRLIGIEPSADVDRAGSGITMINDFVDGAVRLPEPVDLIYSIAVFEHIEQINDVLEFCRNNLRASGELFFVVPNAQQQLECADPALFVHQHVHCFTAHAIRYLLASHGFRANALESRKDVLRVSASPDRSARPDATPWLRYDTYQGRVDERLTKLAVFLQRQRVLLHGACNGLNNIVGWIGGSFDLADNDENKQGRSYLRHVVRSPRDIDLAAYDAVVIVPTAYYEAIAAEYRGLGFTGNLTGILTL